MKLSTMALASTCALVWGGCVLLVGLVHLVTPTYGTAFLAWISSVYPGFHGSETFADLLVGTAEAVFDGLIGGLVFGALYNAIAGRLEGHHMSASERRVAASGAGRRAVAS